jgi:hypothetical protein
VVLFLIVLALVVWTAYIRSAYKILAKRRQAKPLNEVQNCRISAPALKSLTHRFIEGEDTVYWADRQHPVVFWQSGGAAMVLAAVLLVIGVWAALNPIGYHYHTYVDGRHVRHYVSLWWLWILCLPMAVISGIWAWIQWLDWRAIYRVITNQHLIIVYQPWAWAFWLWQNESYDPQPLTSILAVAPHAVVGGRILDYGSVLVKTPSMESEDKSLEIHYAPDFEQFAERLEQLRVKAKEGDLAAV